MFLFLLCLLIRPQGCLTICSTLVTCQTQWQHCRFGDTAVCAHPRSSALWGYYFPFQMKMWSPGGIGGAGLQVARLPVQCPTSALGRRAKETWPRASGLGWTLTPDWQQEGWTHQSQGHRLRLSSLRHQSHQAQVQQKGVYLKYWDPLMQEFNFCKSGLKNNKKVGNEGGKDLFTSHLHPMITDQNRKYHQYPKVNLKWYLKWSFQTFFNMKKSLWKS